MLWLVHLQGIWDIMPANPLYHTYRLWDVKRLMILLMVLSGVSAHAQTAEPLGDFSMHVVDTKDHLDVTFRAVYNLSPEDSGVFPVASGAHNLRLESGDYACSENACTWIPDFPSETVLNISRPFQEGTIHGLVYENSTLRGTGVAISREISVNGDVHFIELLYTSKNATLMLFTDTWTDVQPGGTVNTSATHFRVGAVINSGYAGNIIVKVYYKPSAMQFTLSGSYTVKGSTLKLSYPLNYTIDVLPAEGRYAVADGLPMHYLTLDGNGHYTAYGRAGHIKITLMDAPLEDNTTGPATLIAAVMITALLFRLSSTSHHA